MQSGVELARAPLASCPSCSEAGEGMQMGPGTARWQFQEDKGEVVTGSAEGKTRRPWEGLGNKSELPRGSARRDSHSWPSRRARCLLCLGHGRLAWLLRREGDRLGCVGGLSAEQPRGRCCCGGRAVGPELLCRAEPLGC